MDLEIVKYRACMKGEVAELAKHLWSTDGSLNRSYLEWKYERNPYRTPPLIYLAAHGGRIVGMRGMFGIHLEYDSPGKSFHALYPDDFVIAPEYRNRGIVTKIMKTALEDIATKGYTHVINLSAGHVTRVSSFAMGWRSVGSMEVQRCDSKRAQRFRSLRDYAKRKELFRGLARKYSYRPWAPKKHDTEALLRNHSNRFWSGSSMVTTSDVARPEEMAGVISKIRYDGRIRHVRDCTYLSWRFRNPLHKYLFVYWDETQLEGYLVLQEYLSDRMPRIGLNIVDWEGTSPNIRAGLLKAALKLCSSTSVSTWTVSIGDETRDLLKANGFRPLEEETRGVGNSRPSLLIRPVRDEMLRENWVVGGRRLLDMSNWDIRMIYSLLG